MSRRPGAEAQAPGEPAAPGLDHLQPGLLAVAGAYGGARLPSPSIRPRGTAAAPVQTRPSNSVAAVLASAGRRDGRAPSRRTVVDLLLDAAQER